MRLILGTLVAVLAGCGTVPIPPTYSQQELKHQCESQGGESDPVAAAATLWADEEVGSFRVTLPALRMVGDVAMSLRS
jgi:hypothetical protein